MSKSVLEFLHKQKNEGQKSFAILIDPDKLSGHSLSLFMKMVHRTPPDIFLVGGSLISRDSIREVVKKVKSATDRPVLVFPGNNMHLTDEADALLFLSLLSGRNPEFLIGQHVVAAPLLNEMNLEIIPTAYLLVDCHTPTTVQYVSNTQPIPHAKSDIAVATALAGQMLGMKMVYLDGGSGAQLPVSERMIREVARKVKVPLWVGGGIRNEESVEKAFNAGADLLVVGTAIEQHPEFVGQLYAQTRAYNHSVNPM